MIEDVATGRRIATEVKPVEADDIQGLGPGWKFDWRAAVASQEVYKLTVSESPGAILGLLALRRDKNFVEVVLIEADPQQVGRGKGFDGIGGSMFAFAAELSIGLGGDGFVAIDAKTDLIEHYRVAYGFERIGRSQRMFLSRRAAARLIGEYGRQDHE